MTVDNFDGLPEEYRAILNFNGVNNRYQLLAPPFRDERTRKLLLPWASCEMQSVLEAWLSKNDVSLAALRQQARNRHTGRLAAKQFVSRFNSDSTSEKMGTLFDQPPRLESLGKLFDYVRSEAQKIAKNPKAPTLEELQVASEMVRAALAIQSADVLDEQLGGFGSILEGIADSLERISNVRHDHPLFGDDGISSALGGLNFISNSIDGLTQAITNTKSIEGK
jgi:hypothetical protein